MSGINRALFENRYFTKEHKASAKPCIFLSHISVDKSAAIAIGDYIIKNGDIDIYLDINDDGLRTAVAAGDAVAITRFIERGLAESSHIMCLVSANTARSWWVPYELGFAKNAGKALATLKLKGDVELPPFLEISEIIRGTKSLNEYLSRVRRGLAKAATATVLSESLISHAASPHPLDQHIDWNA